MNTSTKNFRLSLLQDLLLVDFKNNHKDGNSNAVERFNAGIDMPILYAIEDNASGNVEILDNDVIQPLLSLAETLSMQGQRNLYGVMIRICILSNDAAKCDIAAFKNIVNI